MPSRKKSTHELRLRVFAGPNGSGKSTIIHSVRATKANGRPIDFGYYINADDITQALRRKKFSFSSFRIRVTSQKIIEFARQSGLLNKEFDSEMLERGFLLRNNSILLRQGIDHKKWGKY